MGLLKTVSFRAISFGADLRGRTQSCFIAPGTPGLPPAFVSGEGFPVPFCPKVSHLRGERDCHGKIPRQPTAQR